MGEFFALLKSAPAIFAMLLELKKLWDAFLSNAEKQKHMEEMAQALKEARENHDTTKATELLNRIVTSKPNSN